MIQRQAIFHFKPFSNKQLKLLTWWLPNSPVKDMDGIIADGAIRSGKDTIHVFILCVMGHVQLSRSKPGHVR